MGYRKLILGASGIYLCYLTISIISERIYSNEYPSSINPQLKQKFIYPCLIVWFSSLLCAVFGAIKGIANKQAKNPISQLEQMNLGLLYTFNTLCANYCLLYISYLTQAVGRNSRYLMVVINGVFFSRIKSGSALRLSAKKIIPAVVITVSVIAFTTGKAKGDQSNQIGLQHEWKGYVLLLASVIADALFSDSQAYCKFHFKPSSNHLFVAANFYTFLFVFIFSIVNGQIIEQITFCLNHRQALIDMLLMAVAQVLGQITIYYVVLNFRQHVFPLISASRRVFSILLSIIIYGHSMSTIQKFSIISMFLGLGYQLSEEIAGQKGKKDATQKEKGK